MKQRDKSSSRTTRPYRASVAMRDYTHVPTLDFNILDHHTDKANKFDMSYKDDEIIPMVSTTMTSSSISFDDDDDEDDDFIPAPNSIVPFSSNEMIPVILSGRKEGELFLLPDGADCIDVLIDPTTDTGYTTVQHDKIEIVFDYMSVEEFDDEDDNDEIEIVFYDDNDDDKCSLFSPYRPSDIEENTTVMISAPQQRKYEL